MENENKGSSASRFKPLETVLFGLLLAAILALFHGYGNDSHAAVEGRSLLRWIHHQWTLAGGDFSHGWLMPLVSLYVVWTQRRELARAEHGVSLLGGMALLGAFVLHWAAYRAQQPRISLVALAVALWAAPTFIYGLETGRILLFPAGYLLLCFTSYFLVSLTMPLRLQATRLSAFLLQGIGIPAVRQGTAIYSAAGGGFQFDVADPCSGLRSLVIMTALSAPYAYFTQKTQVRRWILFLLSVPLAMLANALRIVTLGVVAQLFGQEPAMKLYHDFSGYLVFILAVLLVAGAGSVLNRIPKYRRRRWTSKKSRPS